MFNKLFKKQKNIEVMIMDEEKPSTIALKESKKYPKEILEIHNEFHTAADKLVLEAKQIISEAASKNVSKVNRLESLGFKQAAQVTELKPLQQKAELSKEQLESLAYYQLNYPNNKFITKEQVKIICHKYNLVCGDVNRFKGFVPEKNLKDIEAFKLKDEDIVLTGVLWGGTATKSKINITIKDYNMLLDRNVIRGDKDNLIGDQRWCEAKNIGFTSHSYFDNIELLKLQICAPIKDMDISGLELKEGYKLEKKHIPDPVVLQPVKNGYLILTAWGDEASDELVVNQKFN